MSRSLDDEILSALLKRTGEGAPERRLDATSRALDVLDAPHTRYPLIHVTGTNGKTSTSRMAATLLRMHGSRVGLFTSPHLVTLSERIAIGEAPVEQSLLQASWGVVEPALRVVDDELRAEDRAPITFFEALTVIAFHTFALAGVDSAVIEVGMGGEWDSTNVADGRVAVMTPISLDHTHQLGGSIEQIARTKSGIVKPGSTVISAAQDPRAMREIATRAKRLGAPLLVETADFGGEIVARTPVGQVVKVSRLSGEDVRAELRLHGAYQAANATVAVAAVDSFLADSPPSRATVEAGLSRSTSPGRLQVIGWSPRVIVDAAHNPAGAAALARAIAEWPNARYIAVVLGILNDKDVSGFVDQLSPLAARYFVTRSSSPRALPPAMLARVVLECAHAMAEVFDRPDDALDAATKWARSTPGSLVVVTGSITLIGEVLQSHPDRG